jgi:hypothetical protein
MKTTSVAFEKNGQRPEKYVGLSSIQNSTSRSFPQSKVLSLARRFGKWNRIGEVTSDAR